MCRAGFLDGIAVVRRLTVGVAEASGAVCVGEILEFCQNITQSDTARLCGLRRCAATPGMDSTDQGEQAVPLFHISRELPAQNRKAKLVQLPCDNHDDYYPPATY